MKRLLIALIALLGLALPLAAAQAQPPRENAYFAGGCFWCAEADLAKIPGVIDVVSGYAGGDIDRPTYENHPGYIEAVKVTFDPTKISYRALTDRFFRLVDPTDGGGQFCDRGREYTTAIWVVSEPQREAALAAKVAAQARLKVKAPIVTPILTYKSFWPAEGYHQDYAKKNALKYRYYRTACGRDGRLKQVWGR